ncbi:hypothetical protein T01_1681 [Trichinella spiralis]|uniref:Uncharacterized protein n=1 Tax=Trichinella spiralis TaxID=6334 RepID=A0A0V0YVB4_TRISP|nr:hypothetical protein T01_1681 [Trichinella spiralis]
MVQSSEKANVEKFNFLPCSCSSSWFYPQCIRSKKVVTCNIITF